MRYFYSSFIIAFFGVALGYVLGGFAGVYICTLLAILEVSLSFDNAVVNAKVLNQMEPIWQKRFIVFGIPIAVFGMRFVFPVLIVSLATSLGFTETLFLALKHPHEYKEALEGSKDMIYAFGGLFLFMVFLDFLLSKKEEYWLAFLEHNALVKFFSSYKLSSLFLSLALSFGLYLATHSIKVLFASLLAIFLHVCITSLDRYFAKGAVKNGLLGFIYLEVLDASFSLDGVIGAFALSHDIFIIMIGLGIGAFFVRSLTLYLVHKKTLARFVYLDHGAHYAILMLALIMLSELFVEVSDILTGTVGVGFIIASLISSLRKKEG